MQLKPWLLLAALLFSPAALASQMEINNADGAGGTLKLDALSGGGQLTLAVPNTVTSYTLVLPGAAGAAGQTLIYGTPSTWGTLGVTAGGTGITSVTANQMFLATATNTMAAKAVPDCPDTSGQHMNFVAATHNWSCGSSGANAVVTGYLSGCELRNTQGVGTALDVTACTAADRQSTVMMSTSTDCTVDLAAANGAGGLDAGGAANGTWYGVFIINGPTGTNCILSAITKGSSASFASTTAGSTTLTLASSTTWTPGTRIFVEGAGLSDGTNPGGQNNTIVSGSGTSYVVQNKWYSTVAAGTLNYAYFSGLNGGDPVFPSGYSVARLVGMMKTQPASTSFNTFYQSRKTVLYPNVVLDVSAVLIGTATPGKLIILDVPPFLQVFPSYRFYASASAQFSCGSPSKPLQVPVNSPAAPGQDGPVTAGYNALATCLNEPTNIYGQQRIITSGAAVTYSDLIKGWHYSEQVTQ